MPVQNGQKNFFLFFERGWVTERERESCRRLCFVFCFFKQNGVASRHFFFVFEKIKSHFGRGKVNFRVITHRWLHFTPVTISLSLSLSANTHTLSKFLPFFCVFFNLICIKCRFWKIKLNPLEFVFSYFLNSFRNVNNKNDVMIPQCFLDR